MTSAATATPALARGTARAVVTGMSAVTAIGVGLEEYWRNLLDGACGIRPITRFDTTGYPIRVAGEIPDFDSARVPSRLVVQTDRWTHFGLLAGELALADAGVDPAELPEYELSVHTASGSGGNEFGQRELQALWAEGPSRVGVYQSIAWFYAATTGQLSIRHGMKGWSGVLVAEQAGGLDVVAQARRSLAQGSRIVLTGATEAALNPAAFTSQIAGGMLSAAGEYLPFDEAASGFLPGEGGAMFVVESAEHASARAARPYGVVAGHAATFDPAPDTGRPPGLRRAVETALAEAGVAPSDVDVVFADADGRAEADAAEALVLTEVFGPRGVPVTTTKAATGRLVAGSAALDVVTALLAMRDGVIPPVVNVRRPAVDLDLVLDRPRPAALRTALVLARGYPGFNSALVLRAAAPN
ncbi:act minimal PKS chain-length factor (CLF/KS beta) [Streptoalloteichus tenebrarius]|uniref:Act minimal PKS chain-length factor (CLF/KS beta) n=1 Tax=Streptoalloteichus tenebrarius (strain ATCC 17920 / DSM 40477 / JCM 4838 / CBS 697.72 / NBRC 16177 / NCIMB 11028 / NRRL B-12390 / A12253. 1 / ISP 5477) TaxID=1933 RepID=A0ABT1HWZ9_STRSD|nr:ketosynthase chain-length factor [Streptoalloteichus tenebrarius]MCP2260057.1 act minimal PKS chain-length factor (CLF/KS beta) [Streptoalloteichus tenebrarius]BFF03821.1 ketosynthase chain-length factor [Streptoalloteichus tenebrarius]